MFDPVRKPSHYIEGRNIEPIDVIEDWELGFHLGNALKYIARAGRKDPSKMREDLSKAIWYLERKQDELKATDPILTTAGGLRSPQSRRADYVEDQEEVEFRAMAELGTVAFGPDDFMSGKDLEQFMSQEIVTTYEEDGAILGIQKNGDVRVLKHKPDLYDQLPSDVEPFEVEVEETIWPTSDI